MGVCNGQDVARRTRIFSEEENFLIAYAKLSRCVSSWQWLLR